MKNLRYITVLLLLLITATAFSGEFPARPKPPRLVNDLANLFSPEQTAALESKLVAYNDSTSTQIAVVTISDLAGYDIADFTDRVGEQWGVGKKGINNGLMILIKPKTSATDRGYVRISAGYGLEEKVTDAASSEIINQMMIPEFQKNNYYGGVDKAVNVLFGLCSGQFKADQVAKETDYSWVIILIVVLFIFFISFIRRNHYKNIGSSGSGSGAPFIFFPGFGGGGGGEGFGGGDSGGFGGFGGGSFGGGGASGSW